MEGREQKEETASTDEAASTIAAGRYHGCSFCKRGFQTSQVLGGHMNIHRRERSRIRPVAKPMLTRVDDWEGYHPYSRHPRHALQLCERWANCVVYFPGNSESSKKLRRTRERPAAAEVEKRKVDEGKERREEDLDLELRLGYAW